jgi:hypothetical protein
MYGRLEEGEKIVFSSPVLDKSALFSKKRHLVLTDRRRLLCIKQSKNKVRVKIALCLQQPEEGEEANESSLLWRVDEDGAKGFSLHLVSVIFF